MSLDIRPARAEEMDQFGLMGAYSYAGAFGDGPDNVVRNSNRPEWTLCAFDGDVMATSFAAFPFTIRANGQTLAYAGISAVGARPEYRRRGLLRKIITRAFAEQRERGQSVAGLWASQAAIYRRYGFAQMGANRSYQVDTVDLNLLQEPTLPYMVKRYAEAQALPQMKSVYQAFAAQRFGYLHRSSAIWRNTILGPTTESGPLWSVVVSRDQQPLAYAIYTLRGDKVPHAARSQEIVLRDLAWIDIDAYKAVWQYLAAHDLVGRISWANAPVDDPLMELLHEPRMLHTKDNEGSWFRVVDVATALASRGYDTEGELVIEMEPDDLAPWNDGRWLLQTSPSGSVVSKTAKDPHLRLSAAALSAAFTGSRSISQLSQWGLASIEESQRLSADAIFATRYAAHCPDHY